MKAEAAWVAEAPAGDSPVVGPGSDVAGDHAGLGREVASLLA